MDLVSILNDRFQYVNNGAVKNFPELKWESAVTFKQNTSSKVSENLFSKIDLKDLIEHKPKKPLSVAGTRYNVVQLTMKMMIPILRIVLGMSTRRHFLPTKTLNMIKLFTCWKDNSWSHEMKNQNFLSGLFSKNTIHREKITSTKNDFFSAPRSHSGSIMRHNNRLTKKLRHPKHQKNSNCRPVEAIAVIASRQVLEATTTNMGPVNKNTLMFDVRNEKFEKFEHLSYKNKIIEAKLSENFRYQKRKLKSTLPSIFLNFFIKPETRTIFSRI